MNATSPSGPGASEVEGPSAKTPVSHESVVAWGNVRAEGVVRHGEQLERLTDGAALSRGLGRSYGDSSLPAQRDDVVVDTVLADRLLAFDEQTGALTAEAGLSLDTLNQVSLPRGWFTPVTPGTRFVTVGGMVASDVHGKNHHVAGTFGQHVQSLRVRVADGRIVTCSPSEHPDLFWATVGGMGLTGHIHEVSFTLEKVPSPWIYQQSCRVPDIDAYMDALKDAAKTWPMTVGWIDCVRRGPGMGRGRLNAGRWATKDEAPSKPPTPKRAITFPIEPPSWVLNPLSIKAFNLLYYWAHWQKVREGIVDPESFFYPLDAIRRWNRVYGPRGFTQYQCVLPEGAGKGVARRFLEVLTQHGGASFLCVIKDCGPEGQGMLSFPMQGISIAVDMYITDRTPGIVHALNEFVIAEGGRIYLTKDTFTTAEQFAQMEPRLGRFDAVRRAWDPDGTLRSAQSVRVLGDAG